MGKASSAKKVARAAGLGGSRAYGSRPPYGYYFSVAILLILGIVGVYNAREYLNRSTVSKTNHPPRIGLNPPWHMAYGVDLCGKFVPNIQSDKDPNGLSTKGDGIIYISPTTKKAEGYNATLGQWASDIGMKFNAGEVQVPGGKLYQDGDHCNGKASQVYVDVWGSSGLSADEGTIETSADNSISADDNTCDPDCDAGVLLRDGHVVTIAFLPPGPDNKPPASIPLPPSSVLKTLNKIEESEPTTTTTALPATTAPTSTTKPGQTTTTVKGQTTTTAKETTSTTAKGTTSTTKVAGTTTTTAAKSGTTTTTKSGKAST